MGPSKIDTFEFNYSRGTGNNLGKAKNVKTNWGKYQELFREPHVTTESFVAYTKYNDEQKREAKAAAGWSMRSAIIKGENRNRHSTLPGNLITLDIDYLDQEFIDDLHAGNLLPEYTLFAHTTRSHIPESPRYRIHILLGDPCHRENYNALSRIVAEKIDPDLKWTDKVSFRPAQMMFMPTVSKGMEKHYDFYKQDGKALDPVDVIDEWEMDTGKDANNIAHLPTTPDEGQLRETADKAEDPLTKKGPVGDWCRAYSITDLVEGKDGEPGILADLYEPTEWANSAISRMTYTNGSTSNGVVVYDDLFAYSHHGSDPVQEQLVNAYDLCRIHLFGSEDEDAEKDTPISKKMMEFMRQHEPFRIAQAESRYDLDAMLTDDDVEYEDDEEEDAKDAEADELLGMSVKAATGTAFRPKIARKRADKPQKNWLGKDCELTDEGRLKASLHNLAHVITNDPRLWRKIAYNEFSGQIVILDDIKSKNKMIPHIECKDNVNGTPLQDIHEITIQAILDGPTDKNVGYGLATSQMKIGQAIQLTARHNAFHPLREYLQHCHANVDYTPGKVERLFIDYFGAEDNPYNRQTAMLSMVAAVARVFEPGCKFDFAPILEGKQGIGKSTAIKRLFGDAYFGEIDGDLGNRQKMAEQTAGNWVNELPELSSMAKSDANDAKAFMSRQDDSVRMAYGKHVEDFPRQFVVWGTTNDTKYLRDTTGGRRYWPILLPNTTSIDVLGIMRDRDALWAEAYALYLEMRASTTQPDLPLFLDGEAEVIAHKLQESRRVNETWESWMVSVLDWMNEPLTLRELISYYEWTDGPDSDLDDQYRGFDMDTKVQRVAFTQKHVFSDAFGFHHAVPNSAQPDLIWQKVLAHLVEDGWQHGRNGDDGTQVWLGGTKNTSKFHGNYYRWIIRPDSTEEERRLGFRVIGSADAPGNGDDSVSDDDDDGESLL